MTLFPRSTARHARAHFTALILTLASAHTALAGPFIYASNRSTDDVTVIDRATQAVVQEVAVGSEPRGLAVHPDGSAVYAATDDGLYVIDAASFQVTHIPLMCSGGSGVVVSPNASHVLVGHRDCDFVSRVELATGYVDTIGAGGANSYLIASGPLGDYVYVATRLGELARASWSSLGSGFAPVTVGGAALGQVANRPTGLVVDSFGSVWISQESDPANAVQVLAVNPSSGNAIFFSTVGSGFGAAGLGIASTLGGVGQTVLAADTNGMQVQRMFLNPMSVGSGQPLSVAGGSMGEIAVGNDNDVTGLGDPNDGSVTVYDGATAWSVPAGRNPDHLVFGPEGGADLNCAPNPLELIYTRIGRPEQGTITIRSAGTDTLKLGTLKISGRDAADFAILVDGCSGQTLPVGAQCDVEIEFVASGNPRPGSTILGSTLQFLFRSYSASLDIPSNAPGPYYRSNALIGTAVKPSVFQLEIVNKYGQLRLIQTDDGDGG